jgi:hypothetical protein
MPVAPQPVAPQHQFAFTDAGRTFTCRVEPARGQRDAWWWFDVSTEQHQRHAPFRASAADTADAVQARVVAYYDDLLARRAAPPATRWQRSTPAVATPAAPAAPEAAVEPAAEPAPDAAG